MDEKPQPPVQDKSAFDRPHAIPPATGGAASGKFPVIWIVAAIVGALTVGGLLLGCLICAGVALFTAPMNVQSEIDYVDSMAPPPYEMPAESMSGVDWDDSPPDAGLWDEPTAPYDAAPPYDAGAAAEIGDGQTYAESLSAEPEEAYDPDWQLELNQSTQDAIQGLNDQKETFGDP